MSKIIISPSLLAMDYSQMSEQLDELKASNAEWLHFDVMDNHFVPNLTFGPDLLKGIKKRTNLFMDVHIMVDDPLSVSKMFQKAGADGITFHIEACKSDDEVKEVIEFLKESRVKVGLSIKPSTPLEAIVPYLEDLDLLLLMSVEPGFGGQSFMESVLEKIVYFKNVRYKEGFHYLIQIDGGINDKTGAQAKEAGADVLVAGSYIFKDEIYDSIQSLLNA